MYCCYFWSTFITIEKVSLPVFHWFFVWFSKYEKIIEASASFSEVSLGNKKSKTRPNIPSPTNKLDADRIQI